MARIYKRTDRISVKIDDVMFKVAPLSIDQKLEIQQAMLNGRVKGDLKEATRGLILSLKCSIKSVEGIVDGDGNPYQLKFENDLLSDESIDDLLNLQLTKKLTMVCATLANGIPDEFTDESGVKLEGVEIVREGNPSKN